MRIKDLQGRCPWVLFLLFAAPILGTSAQQSDNYTLTVCPNALWKDLLFLRGPSAQSTLDNVTHWKQAEFKDYAKQTVLPQLQANIAFLVVTAVYIIGFLLWRLARRCCMMCCMRESCAEQRAAADPKTIIGGCSFWMLKIFLMLVAIVAVGEMVAGILLAEKDVVDDLWPPLDRFNGHLITVADDIDGLKATLDGVAPIVNNLSAIADNDVNFTALRTSLQGVGTFLGLPAADPSSMDSALTSLGTAVTSARSQLSSWQSQLSAMQPNVSSVAANVGSLGTAVSTFSAYSSKLSALSLELASLTAASGPSYSTTNLAAALTAVDLATWRPTVDGMLSALDAWKGLQAAVDVSALTSAANALDASFTSLKNVQLTAAVTSVNNFLNAWNTYSSAFGTLLARVDSIEANVVVLDSATASALQPLRTLYTNMSSFLGQSPSPASLTSNLTALISELDIGPAGSLVTSLNTLLNAAPASVLTGARTAIAGVKTTLDSLHPKKDATAAALATYSSSATQPNFDELKATVSGAGNTGPLTSAAQTAAAAAAADSNVLAVQTAVTSGGLAAQATSLNSTLATAVSAAATAANRLSPPPTGRVPSLGPYTALTGAARSAYSGLPSPKSSALDAVYATVNDVEDQMVKLPASVQYQVTSTQASLTDSARKMRTEVIDKINKFEADAQPPLDRADNARYTATVVVFAVGAVFAALLLLFVGVNCPWGVAFAILLLLVLALLLFALAAGYAAGLVVAQDGCYHVEHIAITNIGSNSSLEPLLEYYFFAPINTTARAALLQANIVDVDKVEAQVTGQASSIVANITSIYTPRPRLQALLNSITVLTNSTLSQLNNILVEASAEVVRPLYEDVKSVPCCDLATYGAKSWVLFTLGGWLLMFGANLAMGFLGRLDKLPQSGCCGCKPLLLSRLQTQVHPDEESDLSDAEKPLKAVALSAPGQQTMADKAAAPVGVEPAADAVPSAPPLPPAYGSPYGMPPYGMPPVSVYPPPPMAAANLYDGSPMQPYGAAPGAQHYVGAFVGTPMVPQGGVTIDPFTGGPMLAPPPAPVAAPSLRLPSSSVPRQLPPIQQGPPAVSH